MGVRSLNSFLSRGVIRMGLVIVESHQVPVESCFLHIVDLIRADRNVILGFVFKQVFHVRDRPNHHPRGWVRSPIISFDWDMDSMITSPGPVKRAFINPIPPQQSTPTEPTGTTSNLTVDSNASTDRWSMTMDSPASSCFWRTVPPALRNPHPEPVSLLSTNPIPPQHPVQQLVSWISTLQSVPTAARKAPARKKMP